MAHYLTADVRTARFGPDGLVWAVYDRPASSRLDEMANRIWDDWCGPQVGCVCHLHQECPACDKHRRPLQGLSGCGLRPSSTGGPVVKSLADCSREERRQYREAVGE